MGGAAADFDAFVAARGASLWRSALLLTTDPQLAEDLVQTTLLEAWRRWSRIGELEHAEAYVRRILVTSHLKSKRRKVGETVTAAPPDAPYSDQLPVTELQRALRELSPAQRAVIVLRYFEDKSESQVADVLGCSVGTVKSHHSRAMTRLRELPYLSIEVAP
jgi:RNA polymerase sigma-70 factor (sigma-E family)